MAQEASTVADRYQLERRIGAGGMSTVYLAVDQVLERNVAVKLLAEHLADDESFVARFKREAQSAAGLAHPNIVQVYDSGVDHNQHFIVMEYVPGQSVAQLLRDEKSLTIGRAVDIACQACAGLNYAHNKGIVHRDIKPGNLLISEEGTVKLADFGIAKATEQTRITQVGSVLGTAAYLSPEQAHGKETTSASDIYSLGVVVYQMLAGRLPYEYSSLTELALKQQTEEIPPLPSLSDRIPVGLDNAVAKALTRNPDSRYATANEMADALERGAEGMDVPRPPVEPTQMTHALVDEYGTDQHTMATRALPQTQYVQTGGAEATRARPREKEKSGRGFKVFFIVLLLGIAAGVTVILTSNSDQGRKVEKVVENTVQNQIQGIKTLIEDNTK